MRLSQGKERGFTLVEVLVAFAILALTLVAAYGVFSDAARATANGEAHGTALALAQAKLAEIDAHPLDRSVTGSGEFDGRFAWRVEVHDLPGHGEADGDRPVTVKVVVEWDTGRALSLETIRLRRQ